MTAALYTSQESNCKLDCGSVFFFFFLSTLHNFPEWDWVLGGGDCFFVFNSNWLSVSTRIQKVKQSQQRIKRELSPSKSLFELKKKYRQRFGFVFLFKRWISPTTSKRNFSFFLLSFSSSHIPQRYISSESPCSTLTHNKELDAALPWI